jgi:PTS system mannose-specific IIA component
MIGLIVACHGRLAQELLNTAKQVVGDFPQTEACAIEAGMPLEDIRARLSAALSATNTGEGVVILSDVLGGTPCNQSLLLCGRGAIEVITGVNLPVLLKANALRSSGLSLREFTEQLVHYGRRTVTCASDALRAQHG